MGTKVGIRLSSLLTLGDQLTPLIIDIILKKIKEEKRNKTKRIKLERSIQTRIKWMEYMSWGNHKASEKKIENGARYQTLKINFQTFWRRFSEKFKR